MSVQSAPRPAFSAARAAKITADDPAFRVPSRPRLLPGLVRVALPDGLVVDGAENRQVFRGAAATGFLPGLLTALAEPAGCTTADLADRVGIREAQARGAVALLYANGLLDQAPEDADATSSRVDEQPTGPAATRTWVARHLDTSRLHRSREGVWQAVRSTTIRVLGPGPAVTALTASLAEHGLNLTDDPGAALTVVLSLGHDDRELLQRADAEARASGGDWLRVLLTPDEVRLGPVLGPDEGRCLSCLAAAGQLRDPAADDPQPNDGASAEPALALSLALLATQVVQLVSGSGRPLVLSGVMTFDLVSWRHALHSTPRVPGCPDCGEAGPGGIRAASPLTLAHAFDAAIRFPAYRRQRPKDHQQHYAAKNLALQQDVRPRRTDLVPLPAPTFAVDDEPVAASAPRVDLTTLAVLLHRAVGRLDVVGGESRRCAPSGGNIGSPAAYLVVHDVDGLTPGTYRYEAREHGLLRLPGGTGTSPEMTSVGAEPDAAAVVVLTGDVEHTARKYVEFAYRVVHLDAGVVLAQLRLAACSRGIDCRPAPRFDDQACARLLGLDVEQTPVTAVVSLTTADATPVTPKELR